MNINIVQKVVQEVTLWFVRKHPVLQSMVPDMMQEGLLAVLLAEQRGNYTEGMPGERAYVAGIASLAIKRYCWRNRGPVAPQRPERGGKAPAVVPIEPGDVTVDAALRSSRDPVLQDDELHRERVARTVREALRELDPTTGKLGFQVLTGAEPSAVARRRKVPVREVYFARKNLTRKAQRSAKMQALQAEL